jgi:hypothetical protein
MRLGILIDRLFFYSLYRSVGFINEVARGRDWNQKIPQVGELKRSSP